MAYKAIVARITHHPHPDPEVQKILIGACLGYSLIVGHDTPQGDLGVFFEQGGQLSEEFCTVHDLVRRKNEDGSAAGGYFEENRRVKAIKMRGVRSEGFWMPLSCLEYTGFDLKQLKEGDQFDTLNGHVLCQRYETPATRRARQGQQRRQERKNRMFHKHEDTEALRRGIKLIPAGAVVYLSEKLHGTSFRLGHVLDEMPVPPSLGRKLKYKILGLFGVEEPKVTVKNWVHLNGSRNVILEKHGGPSYYGSDDFRYQAVRGLALHKGEILYGELVGYLPDGTPIMSSQSTDVLKDKKVKKQYGDQIVYSYGQPVGQLDVYVYKILMTNEDGHSVELSWPQLVARCRELGVKPVPHLDTFIFDGDYEGLMKTVDLWVNGRAGDEVISSSLDARHPLEGVVVRAESVYGILRLKHKSFAFGLLEGYLKEKDSYVDTEESA